MVKGPSGSGKTTLLRSLAGLWPYVEGSISRPEPGRLLFCAQQPYLPLGTLRAALAYPSPAESLSDDEARDILRAVQLGYVADRLDVEADWSRRCRRASSSGSPSAASFWRAVGGISRRDHLRTRRRHGARNL